MGFRSTVTSLDYGITWPDWFVLEYSGVLFFNKENRNPLASQVEAKTYGLLDRLHLDIQRAINWEVFSMEFVFVFLHECGGITRCEITKDDIKWSEPSAWNRVDDVTHSYCHGCSDAPDRIPGKLGEELP